MKSLFTNYLFYIVVAAVIVATVLVSRSQAAKKAVDAVKDKVAGTDKTQEPVAA